MSQDGAWRGRHRPSHIARVGVLLPIPPGALGRLTSGGPKLDIVERGPRDAEFKHRCYPKARDLAAFFLFRPEAPTFFFLGALGFRLGGS